MDETEDALQGEMPEPERIEIRRKALWGTLVTPFLYAVVIVSIVEGHYAGRQLFGHGELFLAAAVALTPAIVVLDARVGHIRKSVDKYPHTYTSFYGLALLYIWASDMTLWILLAIVGDDHPSFHSRWLDEWGGVIAVIIAIVILSPAKRQQPARPQPEEQAADAG